MRHCDDYIDDPNTPAALRVFLQYARSPAVEQVRQPKPKCWATLDGQRVRIVMASRFGDLGVNRTGHDYGYWDRNVSIDDLSNFSENR